jgi:hypothetical protein
MTLQGKGFMVWKIPDTEGGSPQGITTAAQAAGLTHVLIKIADGTYSYNVDRSSGKDLVAPVAAALQAQNIQVWGWHYVYGDDPTGEARKAIQRVKALNLQGYVIDAEEEYKKSGKNKAARQYMAELRNGLPDLPIALSSYRFPSYHSQFPWKEFLEHCNLNMPQVYWVGSHNAGSQLTRCVREFSQISPFRPIIPTGVACLEGAWAPTDSDITDFLDTARQLNLPAANFWDWDECKRALPNLWSVIARYAWPGTPTPTIDLPQQLISALNTHNADQIANLYPPGAVHIDAQRTIQGIESIRLWYANLLNNTLPNAAFTLTGSTGMGTTRHFTWRATSNRGNIQDGSDTLGIQDGKISYHYTSFSLPT